MSSQYTIEQNDTHYTSKNDEKQGRIKSISLLLGKKRSLVSISTAIATACVSIYYNEPAVPLYQTLSEQSTSLITTSMTFTTIALAYKAYTESKHCALNQIIRYEGKFCDLVDLIKMQKIPGDLHHLARVHETATNISEFIQDLKASNNQTSKKYKLPALDWILSLRHKLPLPEQLKDYLQKRPIMETHIANALTDLAKDTNVDVKKFKDQLLETPEGEILHAFFRDNASELKSTLPYRELSDAFFTELTTRSLENTLLLTSLPSIKKDALSPDKFDNPNATIEDFKNLAHDIQIGAKKSMESLFFQRELHKLNARLSESLNKGADLTDLLRDLVVIESIGRLCKPGGGDTNELRTISATNRMVHDTSKALITHYGAHIIPKMKTAFEQQGDEYGLKTLSEHLGTNNSITLEHLIDASKRATSLNRKLPPARNPIEPCPIDDPFGIQANTNDITLKAFGLLNSATMEISKVLKNNMVKREIAFSSSDNYALAKQIVNRAFGNALNKFGSNIDTETNKKEQHQKLEGKIIIETEVAYSTLKPARR